MRDERNNLTFTLLFSSLHFCAGDCLLFLCKFLGFFLYWKTHPRCQEQHHFHSSLPYSAVFQSGRGDFRGTTSLLLSTFLHSAGNCLLFLFFNIVFLFGKPNQDARNNLPFTFFFSPLCCFKWPPGGFGKIRKREPIHIWTMHIFYFRSLLFKTVLYSYQWPR